MAGESFGETASGTTATTESTIAHCMLGSYIRRCRPSHLPCPLPTTLCSHRFCRNPSNTCYRIVLRVCDVDFTQNSAALLPVPIVSPRAMPPAQEDSGASEEVKVLKAQVVRLQQQLQLCNIEHKDLVGMYENLLDEAAKETKCMRQKLVNVVERNQSQEEAWALEEKQQLVNMYEGCLEEARKETLSLRRAVITLQQQVEGLQGENVRGEAAVDGGVPESRKRNRS